MSLFKKPEPQTKSQEARDLVTGFVALVVIGWLGWNWLTSGTEEQPAPQAQVTSDMPPESSPPVLTEEERVTAEIATKEQAAREAARAAKKEREKAFGFHCLSLWDGSHVDFVREVKDNLNDPRSFEHDETRTWTVRSDGRNPIVMHFRAKNGFGGVVRSRAVGSFDNVTCDVELQSIE